MLLSINGARKTVHKYWWTVCGLNTIVSFCFLIPVYKGVISSECLFYLICVSALVGFFVGIAGTFRFTFDSTIGLLFILYYLVLTLIFSYGLTIFTIQLASRQQMRLFALGVSIVPTIIVMSCGMYFEARKLGFWSNDNSWRQEIEKYINYPKRQISPSITDDTSSYKEIKHPYLILAAGVTNIPLLFDLYCGGKANVMFFITPLLVMILAYLNLKTFGPALTRLLLLRKIEKEVGYRFQNADYEQIQELRRGFFMAEWLMKDYRPPQAETSNAVTAAQQEQTPRQRKHKRR